MKTTLAVLLFSSSLFGQPQASSSDAAYPITLTVISAKRTTHMGYTTTQIIGILSDNAQKQQLHMACDGGIYSRGPDGKANVYAARHSSKPNQIKIQGRALGTDKISEHTCKY
jgi:hypothetical protein